jgi:regulation of enolase protein 1 (concanavalin A-like superfamily)
MRRIDDAGMEVASATAFRSCADVIDLETWMGVRRPSSPEACTYSVNKPSASPSPSFLLAAFSDMASVELITEEAAIESV